MKRLAPTCIALTGLLCLGPPSFAAGNICTPPLPSGTDYFSSSEGSGVISIPIFGPLPFVVCGPTTITRGTPVNGPLAGQCTIPTEIISMTLTGILDPCGLNTPIKIVENPGIMSTGQVVSNLGGELPGTSFFDVYTLVDIPALAAFGVPHYVKVFAHAASLGGVDSLAHLPPGAASPGGPPCVMPGDDFYAAGFPDDHLHIPCPPHAICCELECGKVIRVSQLTCQKLHGRSLGNSNCQQLCVDQPTYLRPTTWGSLKSFYR